MASQNSLSSRTFGVAKRISFDLGHSRTSDTRQKAPYLGNSIGWYPEAGEQKMCGNPKPAEAALHCV